MSRDHAITVLGGSGRIAAASATTAYVYVPVPDNATNSTTLGASHSAFLFEGFVWGYETTEANSDNTIDFVITYDSAEDGTFATTLHTNANAIGLLDTAAVGEFVTNFGDAAIAGGAAVAVTPTRARVPAGQTIRVAITTAGTSTVPAIMFAVFGHWV